MLVQHEVVKENVFVLMVTVDRNHNKEEERQNMDKMHDKDRACHTKRM